MVLRIFNRNITQGDIFLIIANLVPVFGVWFLNWSAVEAFIVYALETLMIGVLTVLKMLIVTFFKKKDTWHNQGKSTQVSGLFFIFFFIMHFGIFALVQSTIFAQTAGITPPGKGMMHFFFHWYEYINKDIGIMLMSLGVGHLARNFIPFVATGEYKTISMMNLMFQPYGRIFIQQFTVILGSMFLSFGLGKAFILIFVLAKIFFDVFVNFEDAINKSMAKVEKDSGKQ
jgi:Family of unknown function (DUF6498)